MSRCNLQLLKLNATPCDAFWCLFESFEASLGRVLEPDRETQQHLLNWFAAMQAKICINSFNDDRGKGVNRVCTRIHQDYWFITGYATMERLFGQWVLSQPMSLVSLSRRSRLTAARLRSYGRSALVRVKEWLLKIIIKQFSFRLLAPIPHNNPVRSMSEYLYRGPAHICNRASRCADIETYRGCVPVFSVTDRHLFHTDLCTVLVPDASYRCLMAALASVAVYNWNACHTETINHTMLLQRTSQQQSLDEKNAYTDIIDMYEKS